MFHCHMMTTNKLLLATSQGLNSTYYISSILFHLITEALNHSPLWYFLPAL